MNGRESSFLEPEKMQPSACGVQDVNKCAYTHIRFTPKDFISSQHFADNVESLAYLSRGATESVGPSTAIPSL